MFCYRINTTPPTYTATDVDLTDERANRWFGARVDKIDVQELERQRASVHKPKFNLDQRESKPIGAMRRRPI